MKINYACKRTDNKNTDFCELVKQLDLELAERDGDEHSFYAPFNKTDHIKYAVVVYVEGVPAGSGAIKHYSNSTAEVKRMYVPPAIRRKGVAAAVLKELEKWACELGYEKCILETGKKQPEAIELYSRGGYTVIPNYGQYAGVTNSVCFEKIIKNK